MSKLPKKRKHKRIRLLDTQIRVSTHAFTHSTIHTLVFIAYKFKGIIDTLVSLAIWLEYISLTYLRSICVYNFRSHRFDIKHEECVRRWYQNYVVSLKIREERKEKKALLQEMVPSLHSRFTFTIILYGTVLMFSDIATVFQTGLFFQYFYHFYFASNQSNIYHIWEKKKKKE